MRDALERRQVWIYLGSVLLGFGAARLFAGTERWQVAINPAIATMLFVTFLQVPLAALWRGFANGRFIATLLVSNFLLLPVLVAGLLQVAPEDPLVRLGIAMVLLTPCIDYVVTFCQLGRGDARLLLAATPVLLIAQLLLLPVYLAILLGADAGALVSVGPFLHAFLWLILAPLLLAAAVQRWAARRAAGRRVLAGLGLLPVPATAAVLLLVVAATTPLLDHARGRALGVLPLYAAFAIVAPALGWAIARLARLDAAASRAVAFSSGTRNSLVVLPLALAVPGGVPILPAVIVAQTLVELLAELVYIRIMPRCGRGPGARPAKS